MWGEGAPILRRGRQHTTLPSFPKNYRKLTEIGARGGIPRVILTCAEGSIKFQFEIDLITRKHSSRMRTARSLPWLRGRSLSWGISVLGDLCPRGLCPGGLCPGWGSLSRMGVSVWEVSVQGVSVQGSLSWGISVLGDLCPGGSLSWGISVLGDLCPGSP